MISQLDRLYMGVLLPKLADKKCGECAGNGMDAHTENISPCGCVNELVLLDYYEKWWGTLSFGGKSQWKWGPGKFHQVPS